MAGRASHDPDDDGGHAPFYRPRFGHRNFLWIYAAIWSLKRCFPSAVAWIFNPTRSQPRSPSPCTTSSCLRMPAIYFWNTGSACGFFTADRNDAQPSPFIISAIYMTWPGFCARGWPLLLGSLFLAIPSAIATYLIMRLLVSRARSEPPSVRSNWPSVTGLLSEANLRRVGLILAPKDRTVLCRTISFSSAS